MSVSGVYDVSMGTSGGDHFDALRVSLSQSLAVAGEDARDYNGNLVYPPAMRTTEEIRTANTLRPITRDLGSEV